MHFFSNDTNIKINGFKILNLSLRHNEIFGEQHFQFVGKDDVENGPYATVIIGPNGTGKSYLLRTIINVFRELDYYLKNEKRRQFVNGEYSITYSYNGSVYQFSNWGYSDNEEFLLNLNKKVSLFAKKNGEHVSISLLAYPKAILANAIMLTDKFPIIKEGFDNYRYLGIRKESTPSTAGTRTHITRTIDCVVESIQNDDFLNNIKHTLNFLELEQSFIIDYTPRYRKIFFNGKLTIELFYSFFEEFWEYTRRSKDNPPWSKQRFDKYTKNNPNLIERLVNFCNEISKALIPKYKGSRTHVFSYDLLQNSLINKEYELIRELSSLDIISYPSIKLRKKEKLFDIDASSSGEVHFLSSIVALLAEIKENSLILIDEPENSLHPNWQMKYMGFLQNIFKSYSTCHFFVATHSHFMISDLDGVCSGIVALKRDREIQNQFIDYNTFGWSAEDVLYNIFKVKTTRNFYIAQEIGQILKVLSKKEFVAKEVRDQVGKLKDIKRGLKDIDPLKSLIAKIENEIINA